MADLYDDVQTAVNRWFATHDMSAYKAISIPVDALPHLKQLWQSQSTDS